MSFYDAKISIYDEKVKQNQNKTVFCIEIKQIVYQSSKNLTL